MVYFLLSVHILLCLVLVGLVLLQQGKGADAGIAFAGGSNSLFGAGGASQLMVRITTGIAIAFMITSILLVRQFSALAVESAGIIDPTAGSALVDEALPAPVAAEEAAPPAAPQAEPAAAEPAAIPAEQKSE